MISVATCTHVFFFNYSRNQTGVLSYQKFQQITFYVIKELISIVVRFDECLLKFTHWSLERPLSCLHNLNGSKLMVEFTSKMKFASDSIWHSSNINLMPFFFRVQSCSASGLESQKELFVKCSEKPVLLLLPLCSLMK